MYMRVLFRQGPAPHGVCLPFCLPVVGAALALDLPLLRFGERAKALPGRSWAKRAKA